MEKMNLKGSLTIYPNPIALVTCRKAGEKPNIITLAWAGVASSSPEAVSIGIRPERLSYDIIKETGEFTVNLPTTANIREIDICGVKSGRNVDKFKLCNFTAVEGKEVAAPLIKECPINLECRVRHILEMGCHHLFIAEIVAKHISPEFAGENGLPIHEKINPVCFISPYYYSLNSQPLGSSGFSQKS